MHQESPAIIQQQDLNIPMLLKDKKITLKNFMKMLVVFKEEIKALLKEIKGKTSKNWQKPISPTKNVNKPRRKKQTG